MAVPTITILNESGAPDTTGATVNLLFTDGHEEQYGRGELSPIYNTDGSMDLRFGLSSVFHVTHVTDIVNGNTGTAFASKTDFKGFAGHFFKLANPAAGGAVQDLSGYQQTSEKNTANGYAGLNGSGLISSSQLPAYVDDVIEVANFAALPATGESGKIYVAADVSKSYRWGGSTYIRVDDVDLTNYVQKVSGKGLSTNDYTTAEQEKVAQQSGTNTGDEIKATDSEVSNSLNLDGWGDSLTAGFGGMPYLGYLAGQSGFQIYNGGVNGETSAQIKTRFDAATAKRGHSVIFWVGRNDIGTGISLDVTKTNIAAMVASLGHTRYLVLGVTPTATETTGTANAIAINQYNTDQAATYGVNFIDIAAYLKTQGTGTGQDLTDVNNGIIPTSLKNDNIHLNFVGYKKVADRVFQSISVLYPTSTKVLKQSSLIQNQFEQKNDVQIGYGGKVSIGLNQVLSLPPLSNDHRSLIVGDGGKLLNTTTGTGNSVIGMNAFPVATSANGNTVTGESAAFKLTTGASNTTSGQYSLYNATTANQNSDYGWGSGFGNTTGGNNARFGYYAGRANTTGSGNINIGFQAGQNSTTASNIIAIGNNVDLPINNTTDGQMTIGNAIYGNGINGNGGVIATGNIGLFTKVPTARLHLPPGTAATGTAPLKFSTGTLLTTPENGIMEYDGTNLYFTIGTTRFKVTLTAL